MCSHRVAFGREMSPQPVAFGKRQLIGVVAVLAFGLTSLFAVLGLGTLVPVTFVVGFFLVIPLIALLGERFPLVESDEPTPPPLEDPLETLRERYARGEIDQREFERRLEYLLETEQVDIEGPGSTFDERSTRIRERELERE